MAANPRQSLTEYYSTEIQLPKFISEKLCENRFNKQWSSDKFQHQKSILLKVFSDERVSLKQRDEIALAILNGDYKIGEMKEDISNHPTTKYDEKARSRAHFSRHNNYNKLTFLEVVSNQAPICHDVTPKDIIRLENLRKKNAEPNVSFSWNDECVKPQRRGVDQRINPTMPQTLQEAHQKLESLTSAIQKSKHDFVERSRMEVRSVKGEIERQKKREKDLQERKIEFKKRIALFRKQLYDRLRETDNPMMGMIMRCVDDSMAHYFMEKYKGCTMSIDAVIHIIGQSLGSDALPAAYIAPDAVFQDIDNPHVNKGFGVRSEQAITSESSPSEQSEGGFYMRRDSISEPRLLPWNSGIGLTAAGAKVVGAGFRSGPCPRPASPGMRALPPVTNARSQRSNSVDLSITPSLKDAVDAVRGQLIMEGLLPSQQPEKILSDDQLRLIASRQSNFDSIAAAIKKQNERLRREHSHHDEERANVLSHLVIHDEELEAIPHGIDMNEYRDPLHALSPMSDLEAGDEGDAVVPDFRVSHKGKKKKKAEEGEKTGRYGSPSAVHRVTSGAEIGAPRSLKTREMDSERTLPRSPYGSYPEHILETAKAGLGLGPARLLITAGGGHIYAPDQSLTTRHGRWKTGALTISLHHESGSRGKVHAKKVNSPKRVIPFISTT